MSDDWSNLEEKGVDLAKLGINGEICAKKQGKIGENTVKKRKKFQKK